MAVNLSTLLIRRGDEIIDSAASGFYTGEINFPANVEVKDFATRDCPGEHGERVFFPANSSIKAYDLDVEFKYTGKIEVYRYMFCAFRDKLTGQDGKGTELSIYSPYYRIGRQRVYVKSIQQKKFYRDDETGEAFISFVVTFRVTDPVTDILISAD